MALSIARKTTFLMISSEKEKEMKLARDLCKGYRKISKTSPFVQLSILLALHRPGCISI